MIVYCLILAFMSTCSNTIRDNYVETPEPIPFDKKKFLEEVAIFTEVNIRFLMIIGRLIVRRYQYKVILQTLKSLTYLIKVV